MIHPVVYNTSEICYQIGVRHVVLSPGSRNAPLTISFARNDKIKKWIVPDERTAGFIALGLAQEKKEPVVLVCTSGTAVLNYAPAVAEAYYREIPLIVMSADRPLELIDQRDGQTIRQFGVLRNHVKNSYQLPVATDRTYQEYLNKIVEAGMYTKDLPLGPVHLNVPFEEPFYPTESQKLEFDEVNIDFPVSNKPSDQIPPITNHRKILILIGQKNPDSNLNGILQEIAGSVPVIHSPLSNISISNGIQNSDLFINLQSELTPDLLITFGLSVLSKKLKKFLRGNKPKEHWHLDPAGVKVDTYHTQPKLFACDIHSALKVINGFHGNTEYRNTWNSYEKEAIRIKQSYLENATYSELSASAELLRLLPNEVNLHLGNSMPVRYAELINVRKGIHVYCNRGTSGIDGVTSTAVGTALHNPDHLNVLVTGDLSFLYDRNAFFHNYRIPNLRIVVMNNEGGGIFRLIDGPSSQPELEEFFETRHERSARSTASEYGIEYDSVRSLLDLLNLTPNFLTPSDQIKILEVFTDPQINQTTYKGLREAMK